MSYKTNFEHVDSAVKTRAQNIKLLITDVDGVLTEGHIYLETEQEAFKGFNVMDGLGTKLLQKNGIDVAIITGRDSLFVSQRAKALGIKYVYQGYENKQAALNDIIKRSGLKANQIAHIGDDLPDITLMKQLGLGIAVANAHPFVIKHANWQTSLRGGRGAFREAADLLLASQDKLDRILDSYLP